MYAIIKTGGKQYQVEPGTVFNVEKLGVEPGRKVEFDKVLCFNDGKKVSVGTPYLDAVRVQGTVLENGKAEKVVIFKYKAKKDYRKKQGHRQPYTMVEIDSFEVDGVEVAKKPEKVELKESKAEAAAKDGLTEAEKETATKEKAKGGAKAKTSKPTSGAAKADAGKAKTAKAKAVAEGAAKKADTAKKEEKKAESKAKPAAEEEKPVITDYEDAAVEEVVSEIADTVKSEAAATDKE